MDRSEKSRAHQKAAAKALQQDYFAEHHAAFAGCACFFSAARTIRRTSAARQRHRWQPKSVTVPERVPPAVQAPPPPQPKKRGPKGYDWWDAMWADLCLQILNGWRPVNQTEIEAAMTAFAEKYEPGIAISTIRKRAQPLAKALGLKVDN